LYACECILSFDYKSIMRNQAYSLFKQQLTDPLHRDSVIDTPPLGGLFRGREHNTEPKVSPYSVEELRALKAASTDEELQIWEFFLKTGFREDEVAHACFTDIGFQSKTKTIDVQRKPQFNWEPKDKAPRTVPIPDDLAELLMIRRSMYPDNWLIFPNRQGNPEGHFLRILKIRAHVAGLNCGHCIGIEKGKKVSCKDAPVCDRWILHRFRKNFATMHHSKFPARTIQEWLGHSDLETTLRYLADIALGSTETHSQVNGSFAAVDAEDEEG
jgi:integrase/recombinase XerD